MFVNNEIGVIQDIKSIGKLCRERKVFLHTDAAQALGKIPIDVNELNIDLMSMSSHKVINNIIKFSFFLDLWSERNRRIICS